MKCYLHNFWSNQVTKIKLLTLKKSRCFSWHSKTVFFSRSIHIWGTIMLQTCSTSLDNSELEQTPQGWDARELDPEGKSIWPAHHSLFSLIPSSSPLCPHGHCWPTFCHYISVCIFKKFYINQIHNIFNLASSTQHNYFEINQCFSV